MRAHVILIAQIAALAGGSGEVSAQTIGDPNRGATLFEDCAGCHQAGPDAENGIGPHLNGLFGRAAASVEGFVYSESLMREGVDGLVWDAVRLDAYIENPKRFASGTRMNYDGMADPVDRADLLAYLRAFSDDPSDIPEAAPTIVVARPEMELPPEVLALQGDVAYGEYLASECLTCHRADGAAEGIPSITNWPSADFVVAMHAYKEKLRPHPVMQMTAARLSNEEIAALAAFFAQIDN